MALADDLKEEVATIFAEAWETRDGRVVPDPEDLTLTNEAVEFSRATVLYADLSGSTRMVDAQSWQFAAEIYKTYLYCAGRLITRGGGEITSYDGDRVMGMFIGDNQSTNAACCALTINYAVKNIINPALAAQYPNRSYRLKQVVGIDTSPIRAAKTGVRGGNDLVWVGRAANYAAKLTELNSDYPTWITQDVLNRLERYAKFGGEHDNEYMWEEWKWSQMGDIPVHSSTYWRTI